MARREPHRSVILFVRYPQKGKVKTRLETHLDQEEVLGLYRCFVGDILATLRKSGYPVSIFFLPAEQEDRMLAWLGPGPAYYPQTGESLGQRMCRAFEQVFAAPAPRVDQALLVGSDMPDLSQGILDQAFDALDHNDVTLGPAVDGGYYLVGFNRHTFVRDLFSGISWGSGQVFAETMEKGKNAGLVVHVLPKRRDLDTYADLESLYLRGREKGLEGLSTLTYLRRIFSRDPA